MSAKGQDEAYLLACLPPLPSISPLPIEVPVDIYGPVVPTHSREGPPAAR